MKKYGFTLIELLAVIVILAVIALIATPIILGLISDSKKQSFKNTAYGIIQAAKNNYIETLYKGETPVDIMFTYTNGTESSSVAGKVLKYEGEKPQNGNVPLTNTGNVAISIYNGTLCAYKSFSESEVIVEEKPLSECTYEYSANKGVNAPKLVQGMTPIKWDGTTWIETSVTDSDWYSYDTTNKKWANAKTADGSMWVWIPRYIYKISSGWHSNTTGTIDIQFSKGNKDDWNSSITLNTDTTSNASNNTWTNHPGFDFGTTKLTGIWVAKFEATATEGVTNVYTDDASCSSGADNVTTKTIKSVPNAVSWRCINIANTFTNSRNMETKSIYGWNTASGLQADGSFTTDTNNLDTHLMKNLEWGAVAYLSKSNYGQGINEIWINPADNLTTGCAGDSVSSDGTTGCLRSYETLNGGKASTTGNIYGIYDMSGGSLEYVAAYLNNGHSNLSSYASTLVSADNKYKDVYAVNSPDESLGNYSLIINQKGDALYETSNQPNSFFAWFDDVTAMSDTAGPCMVRGGAFNFSNMAGIYSFTGVSGNTGSPGGFRPVLVVATGL